MFGLPANFDPAFLIGRTLEMVCFNQNQVYLHFDSKVTITIESSFAYQSSVVDVPVRKSDLMELLGSSIATVQHDEESTLSLLFEHGQTLNVYDTGAQYESYRIANGDDVIIV